MIRTVTQGEKMRSDLGQFRDSIEWSRYGKRDQLDDVV